jgi:hypothetical protein
MPEPLKSYAAEVSSDSCFSSIFDFLKKGYNEETTTVRQPTNYS